MAVPVNFLINNSSDEEYNNDYEISSSSEDDESMEDESSQLENTNEGSRSSLSSLEQQETERNVAEEEEEEFWIKYPYLKELVEIIISQGLISEKEALEKVKLIGDEKANEMNDGWKALCIKEQDLFNQMLHLLPSTTKP